MKMRWISGRRCGGLGVAAGLVALVVIVALGEPGICQDGREPVVLPRWRGRSGQR